MTWTGISKTVQASHEAVIAANSGGEVLLAVTGLAFVLFPFSKGQKAVNNRKPDHPESEKEVIIFVPFKKIGGY